MIWAQETSNVRQGGQFMVKEVNRVGIRIYLGVGFGGASPADLAIREIRASRQKNGDPVVAVRVSNTGGRGRRRDRNRPVETPTEDKVPI